ncbi:MAG: cytochrome c [Acidobacteriota bacterium]
MKLCLLALIISAIFLVSSCSKTENSSMNNPQAGTTTPAAKATPTPDEFAVARANYAKNCAACHGDQGDGGLVKIDDKKLKVPSLKEGHALKHDDADYVDQIEKGGGGMPKFKDKLSASEINEMVRFLRHEYQGKP